MKKNLLYGIAGLIVGLAVGFLGANSINRDVSSQQSPINNVTTAASQNTTSNKQIPQADVAETLQKAEAEPQNFVVQMKAGDLYSKIGQFDKAVEFYKLGIALKPNDFQANVVLANAYFDAGQFENAEISYMKALEINPKDANARTDLGTTFVERNDPDYGRAIMEFQKVLESDPRHEPALYYLGIAYFRKGDAANAEKTLAEIQKINPEGELVSRLRKNLEGK